MFRHNSLLRKTVLSVSNATRNGQLNQSAHYHVTHKAQNDLIVGGLAVAGSAMALQYALAAYNNFQKSKPQAEPTAASSEAEADASVKTAEAPKAKKPEAKAKPTSSGVSAFEMWFAKNFYDGGFEDKMSKREAALILGIRESASAERIKEAHRRILLLNHPDRGGSAFISAKVNEAKDILIKGKN